MDLDVVELLESSPPLVLFLLLGFQHSESVFHSALKYIPRVLRGLGRAKTTSEDIKNTFDRLTEASRFLLRQFPDAPDEMYDPLLEVSWLL